VFVLFKPPKGVKREQPEPIKKRGGRSAEDYNFGLGPLTGAMETSINSYATAS